jgi:putative cell wall-binding protein
MSVLARLSAAGLALALVAGVPATAHATASASLTRLGGSDRFGTAVAISKDVWDDKQAQSVVLARSDAFPDALAGTPLATRKNGPLLLTPSRSLHGSIAAELRRVLPAGRNVYLLGGTFALSDGVARSVAALGYKVVRLGGADATPRPWSSASSWEPRPPSSRRPASTSRTR